MDLSEFAYSTSDPAIVAAYRQALADRVAMGKKVAASLAQLGAGPQVYMISDGFPGSRDRFTAIQPKGDHVPDGWRLMKRSGLLEPRRGKPGEAARKWFAEHQPVDVRHVMEQHGLPRSAWKPTDSGYSISTPQLFDAGDALWARYASEPGAGGAFDTKPCTWTPRKLSEFHAAWEAFQEREAAERKHAGFDLPCDHCEGPCRIDNELGS